MSLEKNHILLRFINHKAAFISFIILVLISILVLSAGFIENMIGIDSNNVDWKLRFLEPSKLNLLGTDELGRDVFIRLLYAGKISLTVAMITAVIIAFIGIIIGVIAGFYGGIIDNLLMRFTDSIIALPLLPLLIIIAALDISKFGIPNSIAESEHISLYRIIFIISIFGWTTVARLVRANTLSVRNSDFIRASYALGASNLRIITIHIIPNIIAPVIIATTISIGNIILLESVLSFLGLGIQPPTPSLGNMLSNAQDIIWDNPKLAFYPGILIFIIVISFNFLGDGLQDAINPRKKII